jgi:hypothetical protein
LRVRSGQRSVKAAARYRRAVVALIFPIFAPPANILFNILEHPLILIL